ncbi:MAG: hypothetical protein V8T51_01570 [Senegalimassilia faecalis]
MDATDEEVEAAARAAFADTFIRTLPGGYDMVINEDVSNISAGPAPTADDRARYFGQQAHAYFG